jgi:hypothetical protein
MEELAAANNDKARAHVQEAVDYFDKHFSAHPVD